MSTTAPRKQESFAKLFASALSARSSDSNLTLIASGILFPGDTGFMMNDNFAVDLDALVPISYLWRGFREEFLDTEVPPTAPSELKIEHGDITPELDKEDRETNPAEMFFLMASGLLSRDGRSYVFSMKNKFGVRRAILLRWFDHGWDIDAQRLDSDYGFPDSRLVSRRRSN